MSSGLTSTELALLAHELRGTLTVVRGLSDLLRRGLPAPEQTAALEGIDRAAARANALLESALEGELPIRAGHAEPVDLAELAAGVVAEQRAITGRDVVLSVESAPIVSGDPHALGRVLGNLIDNALKYSFAATSVEVTVSTEGASAVVEVADHGSGIPEALREEVFEPFERLDHEAASPGTGLGLAVARSVIEAHGGTIAALPHGGEGEGTIMRIELPLPPG